MRLFRIPQNKRINDRKREITNVNDVDCLVGILAACLAMASHVGITFWNIDISILQWMRYGAFLQERARRIAEMLLIFIVDRRWILIIRFVGVVVVPANSALTTTTTTTAMPSCLCGRSRNRAFRSGFHVSCFMFPWRWSRQTDLAAVTQGKKRNCSLSHPRR